MKFIFYWQKLTDSLSQPTNMFSDILHALSVTKYYNLSRRKSVNCNLPGQQSLQDEIEPTQGQT